MSEDSARRFMNVAKVYGDKSRNVQDLTASALYELAAPKTPNEVREEVEKMIATGEVGLSSAPSDERASRWSTAPSHAFS
ncbi:MAG: hypothetical protein VYD57_13510 [Pseudomonadota bacterium]|nr:hypothetical protein [Pseudomonadota bacterium]